MISTWTVARFLACFCTIVLTRNDISTQGLPAPPKEAYLSISIKNLVTETHPYVVKNKGSYVFSPYGLSHAMSVLLIGAVGETRSEISEKIFYGNAAEEMIGAHQVLVEMNSQRTPSLQVQMMTLIAIHSNVDVLPSFSRDIANLNAKYDKVDFANAGNIINTDLKLGTNGLIPIFLNSNYKLQPPSLLTNAIALRLSWDLFHNATQQQLPFRDIEKQVKNVTMLTLEGTFEFLKFNFSSMLRLPYGDQYDVYFILPETRDKLLEVEDVFKEFDGLVYRLRDKNLQVTIPRFALNTFHNLNEAVNGIGVMKAFTKGQSGLTNITENPDFFLGEVLQRASVDFGHQSSIPVGKPNVLGSHEVFLVDQPFFFVIRDKDHEINLFRGRVENID